MYVISDETQSAISRETPEKSQQELQKGTPTWIPEQTMVKILGVSLGGIQAIVPSESPQEISG